MDNVIKISKSFLAKIIAFIGFYLCDIVLARGLSINDYAQWSYFFSVVSIVLWISNFGISLTIRTIVAKHQDTEKRKYYINCGIVLRFTVSVIFAVVFYALSHKIAVISGWPEQYPDLIFLVKAGCLLPFFMAFTEYWKDIFIGSSELNSLVSMAVYEHIGYAVGCLIGVFIFGNIKGALAGYYFGYFLATIMGGFKVRISFVGFRLTEKTRSNVIDIFKSAIPYVITCIITFVILEMDIVMLGMFRVGNAELANYTVAKKLIQKAVSVNEAFLYAMLPRFAVINHDNYIDTVNSFKKIRKYNLLITFAVGAGMAIVFTAIIPIIYGADYVNTSKFLIALLPVYLCNGISQCYVQFLYYREKARVVSVCYSLSFIINLTMNWILIPRLGAIGAACGTVSALVPFMVLLALAVKREWGFVRGRKWV